MDTALASSGSSWINAGLIISLIGTTAGIVAVIIISKSLNKISGQVGSAFTFTLIGVISQTSALVESLLIDDLKILPEPNILGIIQGHHIHDLLMVIGMIFFVLGARKFSNLST